MKKSIKQKQKKKHAKAGVYENAVRLLCVGSVTGVFAGGIVSLFNALVHYGEALARDRYSFVRERPAFIPLLIFVLLLGAFFISVGGKASALIKGCGIPQAEGAARGVLRFKWYKDMTLMFACCLVSIFMGGSIGAEGPSVFIGSAVGDGVSNTLRRNEMIRRYQITGGACAGLAVASGAPLTGIVFAFEEAHKRFTPEVFICAFSSVIFGMLTRRLIYGALGLSLANAFGSYVFYEMPFENYGYVLLAGIVCGLLGVLFYKCAFWVKKAFSKIRLKKSEWNDFVKIAIACVFGGVVAFLAEDVIGGGHHLIESLGTHGGSEPSTAESLFSLPIVWSLVLVFALKFSVTTVNLGSGLPCGIFIPMIAIGALLGGVLNAGWQQLGMEAKYCDLMLMICMASFFATIVKAPLTAIIMICEFTGSFAPLLPVVMGVSIGYLIGDLFRTDGIYDELLEVYEKENNAHAERVREVFTIRLAPRCIADKREIRQILWPAGARVVEIRRGDEVILPEGDTVLHSGDILSVVCKTSAPKLVKDELIHIAE